MKTILTVLILAIGGAAHAASGSPGAINGTVGGIRAQAASRDSSGYPVMFNDDKPWKVFAIEYQTTPAQIVDESGKAPKVGIIDRICMESAPAIALPSDWAIIWDTNVAANMTASGTGRRLAPPFQRVSGVQSCVDIRAEFTSGLGIMQGAATGSTYIYWK